MMAGLGQAHRSGRTREKLLPQLDFELRNSVRERRLSYPALAGGLNERAAFGKSARITKLLNVYGRVLQDLRSTYSR